MTYDPLLISLPVADRVRAHVFYREGLGLDPDGHIWTVTSAKLPD